ncbi:MAG TPA: RNA 2',3'-cyclic phosphodiesterase [Terracidiphilus sp.]|nr:RNA 2',3'-cyclic phosphodiesterase [Terracidiphilus sp.]
MRLFVGMPLPDAVLAELSAVVARLRSGADGLRWMERDSWHITLQFLGNTEQERYECLVARLGAMRFAPVPMRLGDLGRFDRAGVFFVDVAVGPELVSLAERVRAATNPCGFVEEPRHFHPHITLARAKGQGRGGSLRALAAGIQLKPVFSPFVAKEFLLYESHLSAGGARYEVRARYPLGAGG